MARWSLRCTKWNIFASFLVCELFIFIVALICFIIFLSAVPFKNMKFHVMDASLTQFNITSGDRLDYNLAVNITVRSINKKIGIWYDKMESRTYCYGKDMGFVSLNPFRQGHKNTTLLRAVFQGNTSYSIDVKLDGLVRLKWPGGGRSRRYHFKVRCGLLRLPLLVHSSNTNQTATGNLLNKRCKVFVY
ncbi:hypothetical protein MKX01_029927 [Papaver californicum]|nr:hypothetical protein MKX01_029927 [Papaver californicum]